MVNFLEIRPWDPPLAEAESVSEFPENPATDSNKKFKLVCFAESDKFLRNPMWFTDSWSYPSAYDILTYVPGLINQTWRPPGRLKAGVCPNSAGERDCHARGPLNFTQGPTQGL